MRARAARTGFWAAVLIWLTGLALAVTTTVTYTYDTLGRLIQVSYNNGTTTTNVYYCYDKSGNRTQVQTSTPTC